MTFISISNTTPAATSFEGGRTAKSPSMVQRLAEFLGGPFRPSSDWHRLNENMLRDIGKTASDVEFEVFTRNLGSSVRSAFENSRDGRML